MNWFIRSKHLKTEHEDVIKQSSIEVVELKSKTKKTTIQTQKDIDRINKLLKANGITLKIHIAAGGHNG